MCFITEVKVLGKTQHTGCTTVYTSDLLCYAFLSLSTWDQLWRKWQYEGKTTEINNISSLRPTPTRLSLHEPRTALILCPVSHHTHTSIVLGLNTLDLWNWYVTVACTKKGSSHTLGFSFPSLDSTSSLKAWVIGPVFFTFQPTVIRKLWGVDPQNFPQSSKIRTFYLCKCHIWAI